MENQRINVRIFGLSGDTIAAFAVGLSKCITCSVAQHESCKDMASNRVHPSRFKYAIGVLDQVATMAVMDKLAKYPVAAPSKPKHDPNVITSLCPGCLAHPKVTREVINEHHGFDVYDETSKGEK